MEQLGQFIKTTSILHGAYCKTRGLKARQHMYIMIRILTQIFPDSNTHGANMGPTWVLSPYLKPCEQYLIDTLTLVLVKYYENALTKALSYKSIEHGTWLHIQGLLRLTNAYRYQNRNWGNKYHYDEKTCSRWCTRHIWKYTDFGHGHLIKLFQILMTTVTTVKGSNYHGYFCPNLEQ